jgi:hypothetical protein
LPRLWTPSKERRQTSLIPESASNKPYFVDAVFLGGKYSARC